MTHHNGVLLESKPRMQPGLPAVTCDSCQSGLTDKFDLLHLSDGVRKKVEVTMWAIKAKGIVHSQAKPVLPLSKASPLSIFSFKHLTLIIYLIYWYLFLNKKILSLTKPIHYNFIFFNQSDKKLLFLLRMQQYSTILQLDIVLYLLIFWSQFSVALSLMNTSTNWHGAPNMSVKNCPE